MVSIAKIRNKVKFAFRDILASLDLQLIFFLDRVPQANTGHSDRHGLRAIFERLGCPDSPVGLWVPIPEMSDAFEAVVFAFCLADRTL